MAGGAWAKGEGYGMANEEMVVAVPICPGCRRTWLESQDQESDRVRHRDEMHECRCLVDHGRSNSWSRVLLKFRGG